MIEKTGEIKPGQTPDTEGKLAPDGVKAAAANPQAEREMTERLDDDPLKRLSEAAE